MRIIALLVVIMGMMSCKSKSPELIEKVEPIVVTDENHVNESIEKDETSFIDENGKEVMKIVKSPETWAAELGDQEYYVIREKGTERSFTSPLLTNKKKGIYTCKACNYPLFESETKYKSGTGWPSFYQPIDKSHILEDTDQNLGYTRTEVMCRRCEGHLGHVFSDGPQPTGLRYCINGVSLSFEEK